SPAAKHNHSSSTGSILPMVSAPNRNLAGAAGGSMLSPRSPSVALQALSAAELPSPSSGNKLDLGRIAGTGDPEASPRGAAAHHRKKSSSQAHIEGFLAATMGRTLGVSTGLSPAPRGAAPPVRKPSVGASGSSLVVPLNSPVTASSGPQRA